MFVPVPGQAEVGVGSLAIVALPARRGGVKRRECGGRGGGTPPGLRGREAVSAAQTLIGRGSLWYRFKIYTQTEDAGSVTQTTLSHQKG